MANKQQWTLTHVGRARLEHLYAPARMAEAYRAAAETSRQQFPLDDSRARYYEREAELYNQRDFEAMCRAMIDALDTAMANGIVEKAA